MRQEAQAALFAGRIDAVIGGKPVGIEPHRVLAQAVALIVARPVVLPRLEGLRDQLQDADALGFVFRQQVRRDVGERPEGLRISINRLERIEILAQLMRAVFAALRIRRSLT